jgi:hypothetical protein
MKLIKYAIILFLLTTSVVNAQIIITKPYEFSAGLSAGTTFSSVTFSPKVPQTNLMGMTFGLTGRMTMAKYVGLQAELNFVQQGWKEKYDEWPELSYTRRMSYLQIPFYTHIQFGDDNVKGFINAGPQIGYLIGESTKDELNGETPGNVNEQHILYAEKKFEWGISGGAGIEIHTGIGYFILEGRYLYSFGDIYNTTRADYFSKASGQTITVKLSYLIPFK